MSWMMKCCLLVVLIDKCVNQKITYPEPQVIRTKGRSGMVKCIADQTSALHWYRVKSGEAFQRILYFDAGKPKIEEAFRGRFSAVIRQNTVTLTISRLELEDSGMYYCALWSSDNSTQC